MPPTTNLQIGTTNRALDAPQPWHTPSHACNFETRAYLPCARLRAALHTHPPTKVTLLRRYCILLNYQTCRSITAAHLPRVHHQLVPCASLPPLAAGPIPPQPARSALPGPPPPACHPYRVYYTSSTSICVPNPSVAYAAPRMQLQHTPHQLWRAATLRIQTPITCAPPQLQLLRAFLPNTR